MSYHITPVPSTTANLACAALIFTSSLPCACCAHGRRPWRMQVRTPAPGDGPLGHWVGHRWPMWLGILLGLTCSPFARIGIVWDCQEYHKTHCHHSTENWSLLCKKNTRFFASFELSFFLQPSALSLHHKGRDRISELRRRHFAVGVKNPCGHRSSWSVATRECPQWNCSIRQFPLRTKKKLKLSKSLR